MSDIFISYSKSDHALALKLSSFLESEGWTVWWDKSLGAADHYRDEIMKQLAAARAVITIWSPNSIKSDWVRAEAGRAKADGKLIPVKTPDVSLSQRSVPNPNLVSSHGAISVKKKVRIIVGGVLLFLGGVVFYFVILVSLFTFAPELLRPPTGFPIIGFTVVSVLTIMLLMAR
jgi:TIR domain